MVKARAAKKTARASASVSRSKQECTYCCGCQKLIDDDVNALQCEYCGDKDGVWKCSECLSISDELYEELRNQPVNGSLRWFCNKCEKKILKPAEKSDLKIDSVLQLLMKATEKIEQLEGVIKTLQESSKVFEEKISKRIDCTDGKLQLLLDTNVPLNDTMSDEELVMNSDIQAICGTNSQPSVSGIVKDESDLKVPTVKRNWSGLFKCLSDVTSDVRALKEATVADTVKPEHSNSDEVGRSVVVYGLPELKDRSDTLVIDDVIKSLDSSISVESHKRLGTRNVQSNEGSQQAKFCPTLIQLSTKFDQRKLLSLAANLKSNEKYRTVFIKKALSPTELNEVKELRLKCKAANDVLYSRDPQMEIKYSVIDGKIRRLFRSAESYKVDWSKVFSVEDISKN